MAGTRHTLKLARTHAPRLGVARVLGPVALALVGVLAACDDKVAPTPVANQPPKPAPTTPPPPPAPPAPAPAPQPKNETTMEQKPFAEAQPALPIEKVEIGGKVFRLELAATEESRFRGLSGRTSIAKDGGMLFVFPARQVQTLNFVMRDCVVPIDIIYLDPGGRITAMHAMKVEPPRTDAEKILAPPHTDQKLPPGFEFPKWTRTNAAYEARLKQYPSKFAAQFAIELAGGTLEGLGLKTGQKIPLDLDRLKQLAK